ncbi:unnamed protein product, partial [Urochloa humidicola]
NVWATAAPNWARALSSIAVGPSLPPAISLSSTGTRRRSPARLAAAAPAAAQETQTPAPASLFPCSLVAKSFPPHAFGLKSLRMRHPLLGASPGEASPPRRARAPQSPIASLALQIPALSMSARRQAWQFAVALVFFHGSEYVLAAAFHGRRNVTATSLLISKQYVLAMSFAMLEHLTEILIFPEIKEYWFVSNIGLLMVLVGEIIRKVAVITAGRAFTHVIRIYHEDQHQLITHGVYRFMRHPGYSGFLLWAVGTQVMLCNPVSTVAFTFVLWRFFSKRIPYEEFFLRQFFGSEYEEYAWRVHSGLPFIK